MRTLATSIVIGLLVLAQGACYDNPTNLVDPALGETDLPTDAAADGEEEESGEDIDRTAHRVLFTFTAESGLSPETPAALPRALRPRTAAGGRRMTDDQILRMHRFVASQEATIQVKVEELAEALGRSIEDTEALLRASESAGKSDISEIHPDPYPSGLLGAVRRS